MALIAMNAPNKVFCGVNSEQKARHCVLYIGIVPNASRFYGNSQRQLRDEASIIQIQTKSGCRLDESSL